MIDISKLTHDEIIKLSSDNSIDSETKEKIGIYLEKIKSKIDNLEFVDKLSLKFENNINGQVLTRSAAGKFMDFLAVFLGFFSIPILATALGMLLHDIFYAKLTLSSLIPIAILSILGGTLFALFMKGWNRRFMFASFSFVKNNSNFRLKQMSGFTINETVFNLNSTLSLRQQGENVSIILTENEQEHILFTLPKLSTIQSETLNALIEKFN